MGTVFLSYRSVDNPWGAAGIHEWLADRLNNHRIFRDCVSLDPGTHYPSAIMAALEKSDLLIAIIGPHWLSATHPITGQRLIDRPDDWVHRELAYAFRHDIPVLPVLLKDTGDQTRPPAHDGLPADLRGLALLQYTEVSHRRFREDLTRLTTQVLRRLPATNAMLRPQVPRDLFYALVDALEAVPCMATDETRSVLIKQLRPTIAGAIHHSPRRRIHVMNILQTCLGYEAGLPELITTILNIEGPDSLPLRRLRPLLRDLPPELRPEEWPD